MSEEYKDLTIEPDFQEPSRLNTDNSEKKQKRRGAPEQYLFKKGQSGNPKGRPPGKVSPMTWMRHYFESNPQDFDTLMMDYISNPYNEKHVIEMFEGRPAQRINVEAEVTQKLIKLDE